MIAGKTLLVAGRAMQMNDELTIVLEAMRRAQAKIAFYLEPGNRNAEKAFREIARILDDPELMNAMKSLHGSTHAPSVSPDWISEQEEIEASPPVAGRG
jgi:hypothetical protein